jgi:hypothetical protein
LPERLDEEFRVPDVAMTLNNPAVLCRDTRSLPEISKGLLVDG